MEIACLGSGSGMAGEPGYDEMVKVGRLLATGGHIVVTGGYGGAGMQAPARGAKEVGGHAIGYTLLGMPGNAYLSKTVDCRTQYLINSATGSAERVPPLEVQFGIRLGNLLASDGFIIAAGGGPGSLVELMAIINLNAKLWNARKKVAILKVEGTDGKGWDYDMLHQLEEWGVLPQTARGLILIAKTPEQAVNWVTPLIS